MSVEATKDRRMDALERMLLVCCVGFGWVLGWAHVPVGFIVGIVLGSVIRVAWVIWRG